MFAYLVVQVVQRLGQCLGVNLKDGNVLETEQAALVEFDRNLVAELVHRNTPDEILNHTRFR